MQWVPCAHVPRKRSGTISSSPGEEGGGQPGAQPCSLLGGGQTGRGHGLLQRGAWVGVVGARVQHWSWSLGSRAGQRALSTAPLPSTARVSVARAWLSGHGLTLKLGSVSPERRVEGRERGGGPRRRVPGLGLHHCQAEIWVWGKTAAFVGVGGVGVSLLSSGQDVFLAISSDPKVHEL